MAIRWIELNKYSLVWVEFGNPKSAYDVDDERTIHYGLNLGREFSYRHMAIVISNNILDDTIVVAPLTTYKNGDERYSTNVIIDIDKYSHMVYNKTTIKVGEVRSIDKKKRIKKIIKPFISKTLQLKINEAIRKSFK